MKQKQEEYLTKLTVLEHEIELLRQKAKLEKYRKELDAIPQPQTSRQLPTSQLPALMVVYHSDTFHQILNLNIQNMFTAMIYLCSS